MTQINETNHLSGTVDFNTFKLGKHSLAKDIVILEVTSKEKHEPVSYKSLFLKRLDGVKINSSQVLYSKKNTNGDISELILLNSTGDAYSYGIIEEVPKINDSNRYTGSYKGYIGTNPFAASASTIWTNVSAGNPVQIVMNGNSVYGLRPLKKIQSDIVEISKSEFTNSEKTYRISDNCLIYDSTYNVISFENAVYNSKYILEFYADSSSDTIRVIKARKK